MTPYTASFIFALGIFISNFIFNGWMIKFPISGQRLNFKDYFLKGTPWLHTIGILGGIIWGYLYGKNLLKLLKELTN